MDASPDTKQVTDLYGEVIGYINAVAATDRRLTSVREELAKFSRSFPPVS